MRIVYLLRKPTTEPTVATNALRWGTGALNIDAGRIAFTDAVNLDAVNRQHTTGSVIPGAFGAAGLIGKEIPMYKPGGRWPANLILQHRPACVQKGVRKVKSSNATGGQGFRGSYVGGDDNGQSHPGRTYADPDGTETIPAWACAPECPVAALDDQNGVTKSGGTPFHRKGMGYHGAKGQDAVAGNHGDTGGASRFFLIIGGQPPQPRETP